jgi:hypothetical protein
MDACSCLEGWLVGAGGVLVVVCGLWFAPFLAAVLRAFVWMVATRLWHTVVASVVHDRVSAMAVSWSQWKAAW